MIGFLPGSMILHVITATWKQESSTIFANQLTTKHSQQRLAPNSGEDLMFQLTCLHVQAPGVILKTYLSVWVCRGCQALESLVATSHRT